MKDGATPVDALTVADLQAHPVWHFTGSDEPDETYVQPLKRVPVSNLAGKLVGAEVTISIARDGQWFHLARYHDIDAKSRGPKALAAFLGLPIDEVFPITYDLRRYGKGDPAALSAQIPKKPRERLSRSKLMDLIFEDE